MKNRLLRELANNQKKLIRIMKTCPPTPCMEDTLQDWYVFVFEKDYRLFCMEEMFKGGKLNEGLIYVCMKNFIINKINKAKHDNDKLSKAYGEFLDLTSDEDNRYSLENTLVYEGNMSKLEELTKHIPREDYNDILKLTSGKLLATFRDKDGIVDMKAYQARRYTLSKIVDQVKLEAENHKYLTLDDIDALITYEKINIKNQNK